MFLASGGETGGGFKAGRMMIAAKLRNVLNFGSGWRNSRILYAK